MEANRKRQETLMVVEAKKPIEPREEPKPITFIDLMPPVTEKAHPAPKYVKKSKKIKKREGNYRNLTEQETFDLKQQLGIWMGIPPEDRIEGEKSLVEMATKMGLTEQTVEKWKYDLTVQEAARNSLRILGGNHKLKIINKLVSMAEKGDIPAIKLFLEWQGEIGVAANEIRKHKPRAMELTLITEKELSNASSGELNLQSEGDSVS
jgi:hypothetical protein